MSSVMYSPRERLCLWMLAVVGVCALNGVFVYTLFVQPNALMEALSNPLAVVFVVEGFMLMGALAYLLTKWRVSRLHWGWFVLLSLLGSMAFALPVVLLVSGRNGSSPDGS